MLAGSRVKLSFKHTCREANRAVDWVSKFGHSISHSLLMDTYFFIELQNILAEDVVGRSFERKNA